MGRNGNDGETAPPALARQEMERVDWGGQSAGKSRPFAPRLRSRLQSGARQSKVYACPSFTFYNFSHMNIGSGEADRQTESLFRTHSPNIRFRRTQIFSVRGRRQSGPNPITFFSFFPSFRAQNDRESSFFLVFPPVLLGICHF